MPSKDSTLHHRSQMLYPPVSGREGKEVASPRLRLESQEFVTGPRGAVRTRERLYPVTVHVSHSSRVAHAQPDRITHKTQLQSSPLQEQSATATRGSQAFAKDWNQLCSERTNWNPDAPEPCGDDGESVLMDFAMREGWKIRCHVPTPNGSCSYSNMRKGRVLHHIRSEHLNFLPFVCSGKCGSQTWYVL